MIRLFFVFLFIVSLVVSSCGTTDSEEGFVVLDGPILEGVSEEGNLEFYGAVINTSNEIVRNVYVVILLKDQNGNIIEANSVNVSPEGEYDGILYPSESAFFTISFNSKYEHVHTKEVEIYYELEGSGSGEDF